MVYAKTVSSANFETPRGEMRSKVLKLETFAITARVLSINLLERMWLGFFGNREWRGMELDEPEYGVVEDLYICYNSAE